MDAHITLDYIKILGLFIATNLSCSTITVFYTSVNIFLMLTQFCVFSVL